MESIDLYSEIGRVIPQDESIQVLSALRQDPLVWESIQEHGFLRAAVDAAGNQANCWTPGQLALLSISELKPESLRTEPMVLLGHTLQEKALRTYQVVQRTGNPPANLAEAGLLALALRERRRLTGTWSGLLQEILPRQGQSDSLFAVWRTALACLYSIIPDPVEMLRSLMPKAIYRVPIDWIVLTQLSQPFNRQEHLHIFTQVMKGLPVTFQLSMLRSLSLHGQEALAGVIADRLLVGHPAFTNLRVHNQVNELDLSSLSGRALSLQQLGTYYHLAGDRSQALSLYSAAETTLQQWLAGLYLQQINLRGGESGEETGVLMESSQLAQLASAAGWLKNELGVVLVNHPYASSVMDQLTGEDESAFFTLKRAALMFHAEPAVARDLARQSAQSLLGEIRSRRLPFEGEYVYSWRPQESLRILLDLGLMDEALALAQVMIEARPVDLELLHIAAGILDSMGKTDQALQAEKGIVALDPANPTWRRTLAGLLAKSGDWRRSYEEHQLLLLLSDQPDAKDRLACAQAAFYAGELADAVSMCEMILAEDANNGPALGILGQALISQGETQQAVNCLVRATLLNPEALAPWLALATIQKEMGELQRSLETLRAAVTALPEAPEAHLAFGETCNLVGMFAEALPHFKKAYLLSSEGERPTLMYGQALRRLGHLSEARTILERVRSTWNIRPELAYEYAQVLLDQNDAESAIPVLETALHNGLPVLDGHLLYARILLGEFRTSEERWDSGLGLVRMQQADEALRHILEIEPENLEAHFLRADILREKGDLEEALAAYRQLADLPAASAPELGWRIQWGIARTATRLNCNDIALAAFKEACNAKPENFQLRRGLAEASLQAELPQKAMEAANDVLQLATDNVDNLVWYAGFAARLGENQKAAAALERAVQIDPQRPDLLIDLAQWQMSAGDLEAARSTLESVSQIEEPRTGSRGTVLRRAAQMYMRMQDLGSALSMFDRALQTGDAPEPGLYYEVAELQSRLGNLEIALGLSQKALEEDPKNLPAYLLQADLLSHLSRSQAALAILEHALRIIQGSEGDPAELPVGQRVYVGEIHERFTGLMLQENNIPGALYHAEKAFMLQPKSAALGYRAVDLAFSLIQSDRASRLLALTSPETGNLPEVLLEQGKDGLDLLCLHIETALTAGRESAAQEWIDGGWALAPHTPRLLAAEARLLARRGDLVEASKAFSSVLQQLKKEHSSDMESQPLWLAEAALETHSWDFAVVSAQNYMHSHSAEARAHLFYARVLVVTAEQQRLCAALGCTTNAPGSNALAEARQAEFNEAVQAASRLANAGETSRWQARGDAVFTPSSQSAREMAQMPADPDDVAALIAVLRQVNNRSAALQVSRRYPQNGKVLLQLALCYLGEDSLEGLAVAEKAAQVYPNLALAHAALAQLAWQASAVNRAIESYGRALEIWPAEPEWHNAAGDLYMQIGKTQQAVWHRKQAVDLTPNQAQYAFKLGQAFLAQGETAEAVEYLERATVLNAQQPEIWLALATAYHMSARLPQAMEAAKQAGSLNPSSAEGLLIAGETALAMNQVDQALSLAQNAVRREPGNASALLFLSNVLTLKGREAEGLAVIEEASPLVKQVFPVAFERAKLIHKVHGAQAALDVLEKLAKDNPEEPGLLSFLAKTQSECGDPKAAERYAFKALRMDPNQPDLTLMLGRLQRKSGQLDQAVHLMGEVIRMSPNNLEAYLELASTLQERREQAQALQVYRQAMRIAPSEFQAYYQSGLILRDSKDYSGAEAMLRRAAELAPENLSIRRQLVGVIALNLVHNKQEVSLS